ncbi:unnamed protein product [Polarella glacialis]|uniref:Uncharacterized protein n=1 Tax=Polarella glacialis TaxID=89957 RepID=A0A813FDX6_POLGL|nr:unnamed protein product [Polarella glacialis]CAE8676511.1 unnamed protein product [Polarella glacialis]
MAGASGPGFPKVGFLTEVEVEAEATFITASPTPGIPSERAAEEFAASSATPKGAGPTSAALPVISVYRVEDAELPPEAYSGLGPPAPLPASIPMDKVMTNIAQNLDSKAWSEQARNMWFKDFKSQPSRAVINDTYWYCICWYFMAGKHPEVEKKLFNRISANFVGLFSTVNPTRKDFFFRCYADAVAQAVLYAMFLAYPKSRVHFTDKFRKDLVIRISYWTSGICPEFVDTSHWKLNLGGGDVLMAASTQPWQRGVDATSTAMSIRGNTAQPLLGQLSADSLAGKRASLAHRAPRPRRSLRYSPLVDHFLRARKYSSVNLVRATSMNMTTAEERAKLMDAKHAMLAERATAAREHCDKLVVEYDDLCNEVRKQERQRQMQAQMAKKRLEIRRKEVLRSDPHEYANYLVSLHLLQQGLGQSS